MRNPKTNVISVVLLFLAIVSVCLGQQKPTKTSKDVKPNPQMCGVKDPKELESFLDKFFAEQMPKHGVPGAMYVMVKDGKIFLSKGYGYADLEKKIPVVPDKTIIRAYSVSKSFTATAVMQLVESGKLKLDEDVNKYLKSFQLKGDFAELVTLANLLTHTGGFTDTGEDTLLARGRLRTLTLGEWLAEFMPPRTKPPGAEFKYSNFGASLAGYIVEEVSGEPYAQYMENHILKPLGMRRSSFLFPTQLPPKLASSVAAGYTINDDGTRLKMSPEEGDFANTPAANLLTTAPDIARFMIAHLQGGRYGNKRILQEATVKKMHEPWKFSKSPVDTGYGFFWRTGKYGQRLLFHAGGWHGAISYMELNPEYNLGFFLWYNQGNDIKRKMRNELGDQYNDHYFSGCSSNSPSK